MVERSAPLTTSLIAVMLILMPSPAFAYLDPGTGSVLLQGLLATIAALGATLGYYWRSFANRFSSKKESNDKLDKQSPDDEK